MLHQRELSKEISVFLDFYVVLLVTKNETKIFVFMYPLLSGLVLFNSCSAKTLLEDQEINLLNLKGAVKVMTKDLYY